MKPRNLVLIAAIILLAGACVPSLNPFYTEKDVVFDGRLVGEWQSKDTNDLQSWKFEKLGEKTYKLLVTEKDRKQAQMNVHLFNLEDRLFLDLIPSDCRFAPEQGELVEAAMFPGHLLLRVPQVEPTLQLAFCDYDWLSKYLESHPGDLGHHKEDDHELLTAPTKDLQAFVAKHLEVMFGKPEEFVRQAAK